MHTKALASTLVILALIIGATYVFSGSTNVSADDVKTVRWLLSHQPTDVFARAAEVFKTEIESATGGKLTLSIVTPQDLGIEKGDVPNARVFEALKNGEADIATSYTVALGFDTPDMWAVNLPFLFTDNADVTTQLEGDLGNNIMASLSAKDDVVGLAFTMSGGYRIIASKNTAVRSLADLKGKRIATSGGPVAEKTLEALGAEAVRTDLEAADPDINTETIDGVEITYSRLGQVIGNSAYTKYVSETKHSVFLTAILADRSFYDSLTVDEQKALKDAAISAARVEREDSRALGESVKAELQASGSIISELSATDAAEFMSATKSVYDAFSPLFSPAVSASVEASR